ncbi:hypothetical protein SASPL_138779 [Salvia splendens]|uniref:GATA-type domain-containing protein n=1 Tax=Salvia splendens TaxID=180675 RepID=A0A8X8WXR1_SALSN|nr:GATA transcription factor 18-like [Salvia splendens]KAG6401911.1 hypothetical protein SASPL_138779 [Salvia splendens]
MYHSSQTGNSFFSMANGYRGYDEQELYSSPSASASVDCTLSLGTPSTRVTDESSHERKRSGFGWNILPSKHAPPPSSAAKPHRGSANGGGDPLLARRCANCDTTSTPLWRNGPRGPKSLCNACGIRYKKEERRAAAAAAASNGDGAHYEAQYTMNNGSCYSSGYGGEYRFMEEDEAGDHRMSWRFNLTDRSSYDHDFTR